MCHWSLAAQHLHGFCGWQAMLSCCMQKIWCCKSPSREELVVMLQVMDKVAASLGLCINAFKQD